MKDLKELISAEVDSGNIISGAFIQLTKLLQTYQKTINSVKQAHGLSPNEVGIMMVMYINPHIDSANKIVKELGTTKGLASRNIENLVKLGLIKTEQDEKDRRIVHLSLCEKAMEICEAVQMETERLFDIAVEDVDVKDASITMKTLKHIVTNLEKSST